MIITFFRSSSYNTYYYCPQKYFLTYVLGYQDEPNKKTELGTITHKVFECLAALKKAFQETGKYECEDEAVGKIFFSKASLYDWTTLTDEEVDKINKSRINKEVYLENCRIDYGHKRMGVKAVEVLIKKAWDYYTPKSKNEFQGIDYLHVRNFVWMTLDRCNGMYDPRNRDIFQPEQNFSFEIEKPWASYHYLIGDKEIKGNLGIKGTIDLITKIDDETLEIIDWKGLPLDTLIPTPNGWTTMEKINIGDELFDKDGNITKVLGKSQIKNKPCYKITFDDKTEVVCDNEHLWTLEDNTVVNVLDLKIKDKISVTKPLILSKQNLPIDPYILGLWLGDGRNKNGEISNADEFIFEEIKRRGYSIGENINKKGSCPSKTIYGLITELNKLNLLNNKHIPNIYLRASFDQRLDLLRGLMDSDGNVNSVRKQAVFTTCNKILSNNVKELLLSLGQRVNQGNINRDTNFKDNINIYPLHFRPININPFLLPRKSKRILKTWGSGNSHRRLIKKIELINNQNTQCIMVDSPSNTYLCTENMIPTHNTGKRYDWGAGEEKTYEKLCEDPQLMLYYYAARKLFPQFKTIVFTIFFCRHGGPFTIIFDDKNIEKMEANLQKTFEEIKKDMRPKLLDYKHMDFRCNRLCTFFKTKVEGQSLCSYIMKETAKNGMDRVVEKHTVPGFTVGKYNAPGE